MATSSRRLPRPLQPTTRCSRSDGEQTFFHRKTTGSRPGTSGSADRSTAQPAGRGRSEGRTGDSGSFNAGTIGESFTAQVTNAVSPQSDAGSLGTGSARAIAPESIPFSTHTGLEKTGLTTFFVIYLLPFCGNSFFTSSTHRKSRNFSAGIVSSIFIGSLTSYSSMFLTPSGEGIPGMPCGKART